MFFRSFGWFSQNVNKHMEFLQFGNGGTPVIIFPTSGGNHYEFSQRGMVEPLASKIENNLIQLFCVDTNNLEAWYSNDIHPREKIERAVRYEEYIFCELIPHIGHTADIQNLILLGTSFGGYHAINFALKHPDKINKSVSLSGSFNIKGFLDGYYDDQCYFNNPVDYIQNLFDPWYLEMFNARTDIVLVSSDLDNCLDRNIEMANHLRAKNIRHQFIVWHGDYVHDWPTWKEMIGHYL